MVLNPRDSASAFNLSRSVTAFRFFYKSKKRFAEAQFNRAEASIRDLKTPELWFPVPLEISMKALYSMAVAFARLFRCFRSGSLSGALTRARCLSPERLVLAAF